jgi:hypothetical protein
MLRSQLCHLIAGFALAIGAASPALAESPWTACHAELRSAADRYGVPYRILEAVAAAESGRDGNGYLWPWPWTVNVQGKARYFNTRAEAAAHARDAIARGIENVDLGCFQINWRYHGKYFPDADSMLSPVDNVAYAARLLADERRQSTSWSAAVTRYHTRNPHHAAKYRCLVAKRLDAAKTPEDCP